MRKAVLALLVGCLMSAAACGGDDTTGAASDAGDAAACPQPLPASCPADVPSYATRIGPLIGQRCLPCHSPGGISDNIRDFVGYQHVHAQRAGMLTQIYSCRMPPQGAQPLTAQEIRDLQAWFVCGAPNN